MAEWLLANKHMWPSMLLFFIGFILVVKVPVYNAIKTGDLLSILNPGRLVRESRSARIQLILGIILFCAGIGSQVYIARHYGYYVVIRGNTLFVH